MLKTPGFSFDEEIRDATPEEVQEMWNLFYSLTPEERRAGVEAIKLSYGDNCPPAVAEFITEAEQNIERILT